MRQVIILRLYFKFICLIGFIFSSILFLAQGEANIWYFGMKAGLNFNNGTPLVLTNGAMRTGEGCASISDPFGNLLFYTDGVFVWDKTHSLMPNGSGLRGDSSSTQSSIIIQKPGSTTTYYVFTTNDGFRMTSPTYTNPLCYTEVDMTRNGGLGDVVPVKKNILLFDSTCEKITGVRHCNNSDVWVISHDYGTNAFRTFKVTSSGVNPTPVVSYSGPKIDTGSNAFAGQLKAYTNGKKIAMASIDGVISLFDFNQNTGVVSHSLTFNYLKLGGAAYGVEFSPDGTKLYASTVYSPGIIYQMNLCAGDSEAIADSPIVVGTSPTDGAGSLQLGPDNKIYMARWDENYGGVIPYLGVINNPNILGFGCGFVNDAILFSGGQMSGLGLPNFVPYNLKQTIPPFTSTINCLKGSFTLPIINEVNCASTTNTVPSHSWNFGDIESGLNNTSTLSNPTHTFSNPGTYTVLLVLYNVCGSDTIKKVVTAVGPMAKAESNATITIGNSAQLQAIGSGTLLWNTGETNSSINVSPTITTVYCFTVTDASGCTNADCAKIAVQLPIEIPNAFSPNGDNINDVWNIKGLETYSNIEVSIYNRWGQPILYKSNYNIPWDGKHKGTDLPTASYYYVVDINKGEHVFSGYVTLKR